MSTFKGYSSKRAAEKGAARMGFSKEDVYEGKDGRFGFDVEDEPTQEASAPQTIAQPVKDEPASVKDVPKPSKTGRTIQKDRPMQNGVKMPSEGTKCREVWDFCASKTGIDAKQVKAEAAARGWNPNNASIEYYNWRKFMGIHGRVAAPAAPTDAPAAQ